MDQTSRKAFVIAAVVTLGAGLSAVAAGPAARAAPTRGPALAPLGVNPSSTVNELRSVSAVSPTDAWAVGFYRDNSTGEDDTLIAHWNGTSWSRVPSPDPGTDGSSLSSVSAVSATDIWAAGSYSDSTSSARTLILHWNGTSWSRVPSPDPTSADNTLASVSADSATDAWAAGTYGNTATNLSRTLALHWNGATWSRVPTPSPSTEQNYRYNVLTGVSAVSPTDAWAVGNYDRNAPLTHPEDTLALHWNGTAWSRVPSANPGDQGSPLYGVSALAGADSWAVGYYTNYSRPADPPLASMALSWNGRAWSQVTTPNPGRKWNTLYGVDALSATSAWAVGDLEQAQNMSVEQTLILYWDGTAWSKQRSPSPSAGGNDLYGVSADSATDAWAVGSVVTVGGNRTLILHWDGTAWSNA